MIAASLYGWQVLPENGQFPVHWDTEGTPNRVAGKLETLTAIPAISAFLIVVFTIAPRLDPRRNNIEKSRNFYLTGWIGGIALMAFAHVMTLAAAISGSIPAVQYIFLANAFFLIALGNFIAKSHPNWFAGIRTPWTLKSEHAWSISNRLAGWGFVITGILSALTAFIIPAKSVLIIMLAGVGASVMVSIVISYFAWRDDPERIG